jgi:hypothetical protein
VAATTPELDDGEATETVEFTGAKTPGATVLTAEVLGVETDFDTDELADPAALETTLKLGVDPGGAEFSVTASNVEAVSVELSVATTLDVAARVLGDDMEATRDDGGVDVEGRPGVDEGELAASAETEMATEAETEFAKNVVGGKLDVCELNKTWLD